MPLPGLGAQPGAASLAVGAAVRGEAGKSEEEGLTPDALRIGSSGSSFVTSSMVVTWTVGLGLIFFARYATRKMQLTPAGAQNFLEWLIETL